jgi:hypothetical protein
VSRRSAVWSLVSLVLLGAGLPVALRVWSSSQSTPSPSYELPRESLQGPFLAGRRVSLSEAEAGFGLPIPRPNDRLASDQNLSTVWFEDDGPVLRQVALEYSSEVEIILEHATDRHASVTDDAREMGPPATVETILGVPALVIPRNSHFADGGWTTDRGSVVLDIPGPIHILVTGPFPPEDLIRLTRSLSI